MTFVLVTILGVCDFWVVKNVTGRMMVGLRWCDIMEVRRILLSGLVSVNCSHMWGSWGSSTPLHEAARYGRKDVLLMLLDAGADPNAKGKDGTPLRWAVSYGHNEVVKLFLERGAARS